MKGLKLGALLLVSLQICTALPKDAKAVEACNCPEIFEPVCGSDGVTYDNQCLLDCVGESGGKVLTTMKTGSCDSRSFGENLESTLLTIVSLQICTAIPLDHTSLGSCQCPEFHQPVCGSDGTTYDNQCYLDCVGDAKGIILTAVNTGTCDSRRKGKSLFGRNPFTAYLITQLIGMVLSNDQLDSSEEEQEEGEEEE